MCYRDHDDESSVIESVSKLNEVKGMRGLCRYFKEVAQSARSGEQVRIKCNFQHGRIFSSSKLLTFIILFAICLLPSTLYL